jgi:membrane protein
MVGVTESWLGWVLVRARFLVLRIRQLELLDRAYTLAAQSFVALLPLIIIIAAALSAPGRSSVVAQEFIARFGLVGAAARAVEDLIVVPEEGVYWLGLILTVYAAFTLSKRASRAYNAIWGTEQLPIRSQWRSLVWVGVQVGLIIMVSQLRDFARESDTLLLVLWSAAVLVLWAAAEFFTQSLLTRGQVRRRRMIVAVALATLGRVGIVLWTALYVSASMVRQAETYGPIGVVFALFTGLLVYWVMLMGATLLAAVLTDPDVGTGAPPAPVDLDAAQGDF